MRTVVVGARGRQVGTPDWGTAHLDLLVLENFVDAGVER